ncbi:MAG: tetratricopeptide repeat protein [Planctomycetota bacterium]
MADRLSPRLEELFHAALEMEPARRGEYLDEACGGDPRLRAEIGALLRSHDRTGSFLAGPALGASIPLTELEELARDEPSLEGRRLGPYRLRELIGAGGMSSVYLAERADAQYEKHVAIKLIKPGMDTREVIQRFLRERQTLADLDHPGIARLLDGGTTDDGQPYLVMEHIKGEPITAHCDRHRLSTVARLGLFRGVCSAVEYAHRHLVVHRDLKPGNILITEEGAPKLLDFGIAKLLGPEPGGAPATSTITVHRFFTPEYASPEQIRGDPIGTATDVYSLGVILYELLTGHRPYRLTSRTSVEAERIICEEEPPRPSTAIGRTEEIPGRDGTTRRLTPESVSRLRGSQPEGLRRRLAGDLDNIVLMALRKERERRYASVSELSEDIRRHHSGYPVRARRDTVGYRASKFVSRHRVPILAATAILLTLAVWLVQTLHLSDRLAREARRAREESQEAVRSRSALAYLFSSSEPVEVNGAPVPLRDVLELHVQRLAKGLAEEPEAEARILERIVDAYIVLALEESAIPWMERVLELHEDALESDELIIARCHHKLAVLMGISRPGAAEAHARRALEIRSRALGDDHGDVASSMDVLAGLEVRLQRDQSAEGLRREALEIRRRVFGEEHPEVVGGLLTLGSHVAFHVRDYAEGERLLREALAMARRLHRGDHPDLARAHLSWGGYLQDRGRYDEAEAHWRMAVEMRERLLGRDHPSVLSAKTGWALLLKDIGSFGEAERLCREALLASRALRGKGHPLTATAEFRLAKILCDRGDLDEAEEVCAEALEHHIDLFSRDHFRVAAVMTLLGRIRVGLGKHGDAETLLRHALRVRGEKLSPGHWETAKTESILGAALAGLGRYEEAEPHLARGLQAIEADRGPSHHRTIQALERIVALYEAWQKPRRAAAYRTRLKAARAGRERQGSGGGGGP